MDKSEAHKRHLKLIRDLKAKTVANGCTEAEAIAAAEKVAELMDRYDLSLSDVEVKEAEFVTETHEVDAELGVRLSRVATAIATLTGCAVWVDTPGIAVRKLTFFGRDSDVEVANYLFAVVERAMRDGLRRFMPSVALYRAPLRRSKRLAFLDGMANTLHSKLNEIAWLRSRAQGSGRNLVVLKAALVDDEMSRRGIKLEDGRAAFVRDFDNSFAEGQAAGSKVTFDAALAGEKVLDRLGS